MSYEGLHDIRLSPRIVVSSDPSHAEDYQIYNVNELAFMIDGRRFPALGLHGSRPSSTTTDGLSIRVDPGRNAVDVRDRHGDTVIRSDHNNYPPGWLVASFSQDGRLFVVGTPDGLWCWRRSGHLA
jgi:hypothetical protein